MRKIALCFLSCAFCIGMAGGATRNDANTIVRATATTPTIVRTQSAITGNRTATTTSRTVSRTATTVPRTVSRTATNTRTNTTVNRAATNMRVGAPTVGRSAINQKSYTQSRAAATTVATNTFGAEYTECRDAYFTCMDQFCANVNDTYRRCVCSSRLDEIISKERALGQTVDSLQAFTDLNIDVIDNTAAEVGAMLSVSTGESAITVDKSASAQMLTGISEVLGKTKTSALSTAGTLDIAGDIGAIWDSAEIAGGANIMNLTGERLYNAVHAQCSEFAMESCGAGANLNMAISAYGMYIENDCSALSNALAKQTTIAQGAIRETTREMQTARLENYDAHNSANINECIANVRRDITSSTACGENYVHCLDLTGRYLNRDTGEPIYTADFYQLQNAISLTGDVLINASNRMIVAELNNKKEFATKSLDVCRDISGDVWDEFLRQAITEIYQGQQSRIRTVKDECINIVNECYDTTTQSLRDFTNMSEQILIGARLELSEEMCKNTLETCSNLYGGGKNGMTELVETMETITDQKIAKNCKSALEELSLSICSPNTSDGTHAYPYECRTRTPGEQQYYRMSACRGTWNPQPIDYGFNIADYPCLSNATFTSCSIGYYMADPIRLVWNPIPMPGNMCLNCPDGYTCKGGIAEPILTGNPNDAATACPADWENSVYRALVLYAEESCVRPSKNTATAEDLPTNILADINVVVDSIKAAMDRELSKECERFGGLWEKTPTGRLLNEFYTRTDANTSWGYCVEK